MVDQYLPPSSGEILRVHAGFFGSVSESFIQVSALGTCLAFCVIADLFCKSYQKKFPNGMFYLFTDSLRSKTVRKFVDRFVTTAYCEIIESLWADMRLYPILETGIQ